VYPGTLLTAADFTPTGAALSATLAPNERAITIPLDTARGIVNDIRVGDHVDVYVNHTIQCAGVEQATLRLLMANVPVVELRGAGESSRAASHFTLRVPAERAANLAFGSDEGILWFTLRPHGATKPSTDSFVTKETQTLKVTPGQALHACGGRR
jgi:Flp pilus assembly protein CpaB